MTDSREAFDWLKLASYDGRNLTTPYDERGHIKMFGWHCYMTPEDAARGILLMDDITEEKGRFMGNENYPNVEQMLKNMI